MSRKRPFDSRRIELIRWSWLIALSLVLSFSGLNNHGLFEPDEGRYASMALEWLESQEHDVFEPVLSDVGHYDKPPFIYWITGISIKVFGVNEFAARFPSVLGGYLTLLGVAILAWQRYGELHAWVAVAVCMTTIHFWALSHLISPDMLLCGFCTMGAALTLCPGKKGRVLWGLGILFWVLAWWTKATAALVPLGSVIMALLISKENTLLSSLKPIRTIALILLAGLPWYFLMVFRHPELWDFFLHRELVGRVVGHDDGRQGFPGYHIAVAAGFWLPWWPVAVTCAVALFRRDHSTRVLRRLRAVPWELWSAILVVLVYSFISSKLITYTISGVPFLAVATARLLFLQEEGITEKHKRVFGCAVVVLAVISAGVPLFEARVDSNSSLRKPVAILKQKGAQIVLVDRHSPGAEFYFGEAVCYIDCRNIQQVADTKGQDLDFHFLSGTEVAERFRSFAGPVWCIRTRATDASWMSRFHDPGDDIRVGDFTLFPLHFTAKES